MATIDTYLDELLAGDAPNAPAPDAAPAARQDGSGATAQVDPHLLAELMSDPALSGAVPADIAAPPPAPAQHDAPAPSPAAATPSIDPDLLAELMSDPALTGGLPADVAVTAAQSNAAAASPAAGTPSIDPGLLAELMNDPALTGGPPAAVTAPPQSDVAAASPAAAPAGIDPALMAELMNDPALTGATPPQAQVAREAPAAAPVVAPPAPPTASRAPDLSAFLPPAASPIASVARTAVAAADASRTRTATGGHRWLRVCVGGDSYGFELLRVQEVVRVAPVLAMRGAAHSVLGVMNLRGRILPVFDLGLWLDVGAVRVDERARIVVIERNDELIGVLVTAVEDVVSLEREHVEPPLPGTDPGPTLGVARVTTAPTVLLDADALFD